MKVIVNRKQYEKLIKEERGYSKSVEKWGDYVTDNILNNILQQKSEEEVYLINDISLKLKNKDFYEEIPIENLIITVIVNDVDGDEVSMDMNYSPSYTKLIRTDSGKNNIVDVEFEISIDLPHNRSEIDLKTLSYYFSSHLSHEFMHLNEWVNRELKSPKEIKGCEEIYTRGNMDGDVVDKIGYMLYISLPHETNAFIQQVATMISKQKPKNKQEFMLYLKENPVYNFTESMLNFNVDVYYEKIKKLDKERINQLYQIMMCFYYKNDILKVKDIKVFLNDVDRKIKMNGEYLKRKLLRLITVV